MVMLDWERPALAGMHSCQTDTGGLSIRLCCVIIGGLLILMGGLLIRLCCCNHQWVTH